MRTKAISNIKLGVFVMAGLLFLILLLYMIGRNENLFGSTFRLKARFENVQGVTAGNNVRFAGIQVGTVKKVNILDDTLIEVVMLIETKMKSFMHKNAVVAIGTEGLMGNRVLNISPSKEPAALVEEGDILVTKRSIDMDDMLQSLAHSTDDVAVIAGELKSSMRRINSSTAMWDILNDKSLPANLRASMLNVRKATAKADQSIGDIQLLVKDVKAGKGSLGALLADSTLAVNLNEAIDKIKSIGDDADSLTTTLITMADMVSQDISEGKGTVSALLKDSVLATNLRESLEQIREGTNRFNEIMEGLKHNIILRGYFRKLEKQQAKENRSKNATSY